MVVVRVSQLNLLTLTLAHLQLHLHLLARAQVDVLVSELNFGAGSRWVKSNAPGRSPADARITVRRWVSSKAREATKTTSAPFHSDMRSGSVIEAASIIRFSRRSLTKP